LGNLFSKNNINPIKDENITIQPNAYKKSQTAAGKNGYKKGGQQDNDNEDALYLIVINKHNLS